MKLDVDKAKAAVEQKIAKPLGLDVYEAAAGIREVANNQMADLLRRVTTRSGYDPRNFVLFAYGGAGPDPRPSLRLDRRHLDGGGADHRVRPFRARLGHGRPASLVLVLVRRACAAALQARIRSHRCRRVERRFRGARAAVPARRSATTCQIQRAGRHAVPPAGARDAGRGAGRRTLTAADVDDLVDRFEAEVRAHLRQGHRAARSGVEFTVLRSRGARRRCASRSRRRRPARPSAPKPIQRRRVYFYRTGFVETPVYRSDGSRPRRTRLDGPLIVERPDTTIVVGRGPAAARSSPTAT